MNGPMQAFVPREVRIPSGDSWLYGDLAVPPNPAGVVLFAHGSGSGRHSARNRQVARALQDATAWAASQRELKLTPVGYSDHGVIELNEEAFKRLQCEKRMEIVPGATHLFEERDTLERVQDLAASWFCAHMARVEHTA